MKKLIPALCLLLIAAALMGTSTFAWFSMNKTVTATGMKVTATSAASLVISKTAPTNTTTEPKVDFTDAGATELNASTWDPTVGTTTGLKYVTNPGAVISATGEEGTGDDKVALTYDEATNGTAKYYVDYTVYIAASGNTAINEKLVVTISGNATTTATIHQAVSVAFFVGETATASGSGANYKGTIALKNAATGKVTLEDTNDIPVAVAEGNAYIKVTMRVYLDGALEDADGNAIVRNTNADINEVGITASFTTEAR